MYGMRNEIAPWVIPTIRIILISDMVLLVKPRDDIKKNR